MFVWFCMTSSLSYEIKLPTLYDQIEIHKHCNNTYVEVLNAQSNINKIKHLKNIENPHPFCVLSFVNERWHMSFLLA